MDEYIKYINETLYISIEAKAFCKADSLPLYLRNGYEFVALQIYNVNFLLAKPKEQYNLTTLRKQITQLAKLTGLDCVLCLESARIYTKGKMLAEGIPFIILGQQIFMPFLGVALSKNGARELPQIEKISIVTHKLLLNALYFGWNKITLTEIATTLGVSKMAITRSFDELEALDLNLIKPEGKLRRFVWEGSKIELWEVVKPYLRNPVARVYRYGDNLNVPDMTLGGMSALSHYTLLDDNPYPTYAVLKDNEINFAVTKKAIIPSEETPATVVQVLRYAYNYRDGVAVDPLTAILSLTDEEKNDPRVESAIEKMLEECLHD